MDLINGLCDFVESGVKDILKSAQKHAPAILAGTGISLLIGSGVAAVVSTPDAYEKVKNEEKKLKRPLSFKEKVQVAGKNYILPTAGALTGTVCVILSVKESNKRYLALSAAYKLTDETFQIYKEKVNERLTTKQQREVEGEVAQEKMNRNPITKEDISIIGNYGNGKKTLCYESITGRYFTLDNDYVQKCHKAENDVNYEIRNNNYASLNFLFCELGLEPVDLGYDIGWNIDSIPTREGFKINRLPKFAANGDPCVCISYNVEPKSKYEFFA